MSVFKKATLEQSFARIAMFGPSGAGKTYSALRMAKGLGKKIAFIDSERGTASKYSTKFDFDVVNLEHKTIDEYVEYLNAAQEEGYDVVIIDSLSHGWSELLEEIDKIAKAKYRGNTWSAWSEGTPKQKKLVNAILNYKGHVICTMRSKTEWLQEKDEKSGKTKPVRVGLTPEQGKGIEYEFDMLIEINPEHYATVIKDRTGGDFQDVIVEKIDEKFGERIAAWLGKGIERPAKVSQFVSAMRTVKSEIGDEKYFEILNKAGYKDEDEVDKADRTIQTSLYKALKNVGLPIIPEHTTQTEPVVA